MANNADSNKRIARNTFFMSARMVFVLLISLYTTRVVLKVLGVEDYGVYNVVCGFVMLFSFLNTSMSNGIQRFFNYEYGKNGPEGANRVYVTALLIQLLLGVLIVVLTESFGLWYLHNKMVIPVERMYAAEWIFQFSIASFLIIIMQVPYTAAVMAHEKMDYYAFVSILDAVLRLIIVLVLPYIKADRLIMYGFALLMMRGLEFLLYFIYCKKKFVEIHIPKITTGTNKQLFRSMLGFSGWNLFGSFSNMMRDQGINLIMNLFFGPIVNAARGVAMQVNSGVTGLVSSILTPVRPQVVQSYARGEMDRVMHLTYTISKFSLFFLLMLSLPLCVEIDFILSIWLGENIPQHTQAFIIIILLTSAILIPMSSQAALVHASGKMRNYQVIGSTVKILSVPISYFMLKAGYAPEWALWMVLLFDLIGLIVGMFIIRTLMPFHIWDYTKKVFLPVIPIAILSFAPCWLLHINMSNGIIRFIIVLMVSTIVSGCLIYLTGMTKEEKILIRQLLNNRIKR